VLERLWQRRRHGSAGGTSVSAAGTGWSRRASATNSGIDQQQPVANSANGQLETPALHDRHQSPGA
jgi:hypothetical protein